MKYINYQVLTGQENMRIDSDLLDSAIENKLDYPIFRLYAWKPACVSLGRNQKDDFLDRSFLKENNIDVVRRLTGGRALLHADEITYSFICPTLYLKNGEHVVSSYKEISRILIGKFKTIGIDLDFGSNKPIKTGFDYCMLISTGADLCYHGKKLIGSAQCRKQGYILQHGSILYDYDKALLEKIFKEPVSTDEITSIKEINPKLTKEKIIDILSV
ncbi:MAG: lipoate--protein ligase family protein [Candidatus Gastranaerophilaceae bacterium]|jgi:lipoyl(octanoyl) transferase|nr:lipoate--protein ligase family protein [Cyanobacteriota bacterium]DAA90217.1 MAG TPA: biotin--protein ligase [Candidatus Gastranaerophilales bacterium HUM_6]DAA95098.1 MAG TPA: biotin--protein ligase [Candidatus Gastranaerophilales bacterium HUM_7]DAB02677.1 MAG TPA: biotin--protein ligase [Candidatus Gastranaerophilales bacterium HUM_12]DAB06260.1 MAG TPA: biotin--protein ligase [Candidatus Gastranaerophilales bacterium HUM_14]